MSKGFRTVSAGVTKRKFTLGCENCNFTELYVKEHGLKTGSECPRCKSKTVRLFDSASEAQRNCELQTLANSGYVEDLRYQVPFPLNVICETTDKKIVVGSYICDFYYYELDKDQNMVLVVEDVKGNVVTDIFEMKRKHFEAQYGIKIRLVKR